MAWTSPAASYGYGFIVADDAPDAPQVFFAARDCDCVFVRVGQRITFAFGVDRRSRRPLARHVKPYPRDEQPGEFPLT